MGAHIWQGMSMQNACMLLKAVALVVEGGGGGDALLGRRGDHFYDRENVYHERCISAR